MVLKVMDPRGNAFLKGKSYSKKGGTRSAGDNKMIQGLYIYASTCL